MFPVKKNKMRKKERIHRLLNNNMHYVMNWRLTVIKIDQNRRDNKRKGGIEGESERIRKEDGTRREDYVQS